VARVNVDELEDILEGLRQLPELTEVKPAVFYVKRTPFLHFHESATTRGVDVREGKEWASASSFPSAGCRRPPAPSSYASSSGGCEQRSTRDA